jgi:hypothetical protein
MWLFVIGLGLGCAGVLSADDQMPSAPPPSNSDQTSSTPIPQEFMACASPQEYLRKLPLALPPDPMLDSLLQEITPPPPLTTQSNVRLFALTQRDGGGDYGTFAFIQIDQRFAPLSESRGQEVFGPISSENQAMAYFRFFRKTIAGAANHIETWIFSPEDYRDPGIRQYFPGAEEAQKKLAGRVSTIEKTSDGFLLTLIAFSPLCELTFYERVFLISPDGRITEKGGSALATFGPGVVF